VVVGLVVALVVLVLLSASLWGIIQRTVATRLYAQATDNLNDGDYRNAIRRYDDFLARYSADARAGKARVLRALANVRQFTSTTAALSETSPAATVTLSISMSANASPCSPSVAFITAPDKRQ